jgi:hypothetical protein
MHPRNGGLTEVEAKRRHETTREAMTSPRGAARHRALSPLTARLIRPAAASPVRPPFPPASPAPTAAR